MSVNGWPLVPLGDLLTKNESLVSLAPAEQYREVTIRLWGKGVVLRRLASGAEIAAERRFRVSTDQFIVSRIDARNGAMGLVPPELDGAVVTNDFPSFETDRRRLVPAFLGWLSRTAKFVDLCRAASEGTTNRVRLKEDRFLRLPIAVPGLDEQRRIVARIDRLAAKVAEAAALRRQADVSAEALLASRAALLFSSTSRHASIGDVADVRGGIQKGPHRTPGANPVRYVTVAHVQRNRILTDSPRFFEVTPAELERWRLIAGDVLIIEGNGSAEQIGRTALFRGEIPDCVHQNHVIRIRVDSSRILPEFLNAFLNSPAGQQVVHEQSRTTSGLRTLSVGRIKQLPVPISSITDQRRIIESVEKLASVHNNLAGAQKAVAAETDAMLPAILDRAFKGDLL